ncbi:hypothetical protein ABW02_13445 [Niallia circulans]|uniref:Uncharacterized protein n=1 Tax=Niallia circulans TaxID=1397 RepID=A0A0J1IIS0_NIACI|nr:hypothetical protein [Niallia circulans]KLV25836.1 hypothetical protein ABW02_13445 [Niallia circulans]MED5103361.1 hypothetical protein [Niallia circulans]
MFYFSKKKKIRGWKRHKRKIERWKQNAINLDMDYLRNYQRQYEKLWIHPFYKLERRNPPNWYKSLLLDAMIEVYLEWHQKMKKEEEDFYLKLWLYDPHFINSQIVVAYRNCLDFYDKTFKRRQENKEFPFDKFHSLRDKLEQFEWDLHIESDYYDENDLNEWLEEGALTEKEVSRIKGKAYDAVRIKDEDGSFLQYSLDKGDVWIGTLKR